MTPSWGIRSRAEGFPRAVVHVAAAVLAVTAMLAAMWAGPLAAASAGTQPRAAVRSPAPALVKFYIVPAPGNGAADSLFTIAAKTLGDGSQFMEIFNLNKGRLQPNGGRLTNPQLIEPGWILQLPADAAGPGVHFGPLPGLTAPVSHLSSGSAGTGSAALIGGVVLAFLIAGLAFRRIRHRAGPTRRRRPAHARPGRAGRAPLQHDHDRSVAPPSAPAPPGRAAAQPGSPAAPADPFRAQPSVRLEMGAELGQVAASVPGARSSAATPMTTPAARNRTQPAAQRATKPGSQPVMSLPPPAEPVTRPAKPAAKPAGRPRQVRAMRLAVLAMTIPILFGLISATGELARHGYGFFVFRSAGTGATQQGPSGPAPSQPSAAHHSRRAVSGQADPLEARHQQDQAGHDL